MAVAAGPRAAGVVVAGVVVGGLVVGGLVVVAVRRRYVVVTVDGRSMQPSYATGDRVLVRRTRVHALRAGQVVVFRSPGSADPELPAGVAPEEIRYVLPDTRLLIKRVIAAPGDPVPRERVPSLLDANELTVPPGLAVVLGDNQEVSYDSREYGYLAGDLIVGVAVRRLAGPARWPAVSDGLAEGGENRGEPA